VKTILIPFIANTCIHREIRFFKYSVMYCYRICNIYLLFYFTHLLYFLVFDSKLFSHRIQLLNGLIIKNFKLLYSKLKHLVFFLYYVKLAFVSFVVLHCNVILLTEIIRLYRLKNNKST
jgi:hypothetical protein